MKFIIVTTLVAFVVLASAREHVLKLSEEQRARVRGFVEECTDQEGVTKEAVKDLKEGNFSNVDAKLMSFTNCFLEKVGFLVNGQPQIGVIHAKLNPLLGVAEVTAIGVKCNGLKGATIPETAFKFYECYYINHASWT